MLWAAERAHAWVFGAGRIEDPATRGALTPLPETFAGLALPSLQALLLYDRPGRAYSPELLLILQQMQGVLAIHRGDGASRFRIGLKDLGPAVEQDAALAPMLPRAWQRLAGTALDALEDLAQARADGEAPPDTLPGWDLFDELAPYLDAAVALAGSEPLAARWLAARSAAEALQSAYADRLEEQALNYRRLRPLNLLLAWAAAGRGKPDGANWFAACLANRGNAHRDTGDLGAAIADYDTAVTIGEGIREALLSSGGEATWGLPLRNDLVKVLQNRGNAHAATGDLGAAIADYDASVVIGEGIRDSLLSSGGEAAWGLPLRNDLARVLQNRGNGYQTNGDLAAAIADYDAAVTIREGIRDALLSSGGEAAWSLPLRNDLAMVLRNRGAAHAAIGDLAAAIADYDAAVTIGEDVRDALLSSGGEAAWSLALRNELVGALSNRGLAHRYTGDLAAAIADYDAAVTIGEGIRDTLLSSGGEATWGLPLRNLLATVLQNRGGVHQTNGDQAAAIADYDAAVTIGEGIRDALLSSGGEAAWSLPLRNDLARGLANRGYAHAVTGDQVAAIADYDVAVILREGIRDAVLSSGGEAAWSLPLRNDLASVLAYRGLTHAVTGDQAAAIADYDVAVILREGIRDTLLSSGGEAAWSLPLRIDLARTYCARALIIPPTRGEADLSAAAEVAAGLRAVGRDGLAEQVASLIHQVRSHWAGPPPEA